MGRESIEACPLCHSLCHSVECSELHKFFRPIVVVGSNEEMQRLQILTMLREAKFCRLRLEKAMTMLMHLQEFLQGKGHKFMHLEVQRTLEQLRDRREAQA